MSEYQLLGDSAVATVIDDNAVLVDGARAAGNYDNSTELDIECVAYLKVQYDGGPPSVGDAIGDLYMLPVFDADTTPEGGDAGIGTDDTPQAVYLVGVFESINPSTTVDEILGTLPFPLYPSANNRFVILNTSGQTYDATWELNIKPLKRQQV